jgi:tartrate-resistant acid phosphatase type 5
VIGDYGLAGPDLQAVAEMILGWAPDFILTTGDNNYPNGSADTIDENIGQYFHSYIYPYQGKYGLGAESNRFFPTLGNHDWTTDSAQAYFDYFSLPGNERYYDFTWGPLHFFALNSDSREPDGVGRSSAQAAWLKDALAGSSSPWKIVYGHYPPFSSGYYGDTDWMNWPFAEWGADVVLSGHDHTYERLEVEGVLYFVVGIGGGGRYPFISRHPGSLMRYNEQYGALLVEATPEAIQFSFYAIPGELIDAYTLLLGR